MKWAGWGVLLAALLAAFFRGRPKPDPRLLEAQEAEIRAEKKYITAVAELEKAEITHDHEKAVTQIQQDLVSDLANIAGSTPTEIDDRVRKYAEKHDAKSGPVPGGADSNP